jgi:23S rRNA pseudoU1915 N3-methylase RlmH
MSEYNGSLKHQENARAARKIGLIKLVEQKEKRIEQYNENPALCKQCLQPMPYQKRGNKFCSSSCSASFTNLGKIKSKETKDKISKSNSKYTFNLNDEVKDKISKALKEKWKNKEYDHVNWVMSGAKGSIGKYKNPDSLFSISSRTMAKIFVRMIQNENFGCSLCGWNKGIGDMHHINGRKIENPDNHKNLTYICPNCHRLVHNHKIEKSSLITLDEQIGDNWKKYYYG